MENRCNEWNCEHNKDGKCATNDCPKMDDVLEIISKNKNQVQNLDNRKNKEKIYANLGCL